MKTAHYIYMNRDWPHFTFSRPNTDTIYQKIGILEGILNVASDQVQREFSSLSIESETLSSYEIEGEIMQRSSVRASIDKLMRVELSGNYTGQSTAKSDAAVTLLLDARSGGAISEKRLLQWHNTMFNSTGPSLYDVTPGVYRTSLEPMKIVSGPYEKEKVHYIAPAAADLSNEMAKCLLWLMSKNEENIVIKAGIAHLYFVLIHPFEDGNGRIARAISDNVLSAFSLPLFSISAEILKERKEYYDILDISSSQNHMDITVWLDWWCKLVEKAIDRSLVNASGIVMRARFWTACKNFSLNSRQNKVLEKMANALPHDFEGGMSSKKYKSITKTSSATATRDLQELLQLKIFTSEGTARSVKYYLNRELFELEGSTGCQA